MRPDQTDPGIDTMKSRPDGGDGQGSMSREMPARMDTGNDGAGLRPRERAGSPSPMAMEGAVSWQDIKSRFVDDPAGAIAAAEELVRLAVEQKMRTLKEEAAAVCAPEPDEDASSTEALRTRLIRYQTYCERLGRTAAH